MLLVVGLATDGLYAAEADQPRVEVRFVGGPEAWLGGVKILQLDLLTPHWFRRPPQVAELRVPDTVVHRAASALSLSRRIEGRQYSGLRYEYRLYPQREGLISLPPLQVKLWPAIPGSSKAVARQVQSEALTLMVQPLPPGDRDQGRATQLLDLVATEPSISQQWQLPDEPLRQGGLVLRKVTIQVAGRPGALIPAIDLAPAPEGSARYQAPPRYKLTEQRGELKGERVEEISYLLSASGEMQLPAIRYRWFDPQSGAWQQQLLPGKTVQVATDPAFAQAPLSAAATTSWSLTGWLAGIALAMLLLFLGWQYRNYRAQPGQRLQRQLRQALKAQRWSSLIGTLYRWFDLEAAPDQLATLSRCQIPQLDLLVAQKYARPATDGDSTPAAPLDYPRLARSLRHGLAQRSAGRAKPQAPLPPLYTEFNRAAEAANKENRCP